jgi:pimeloyl-ACP methyl ester carboxylesterase
MSLLRRGCPTELLASIPTFLSQLSTPTLIMHGSKDPGGPESFATRASRMIPN